MKHIYTDKEADLITEITTRVSKIIHKNVYATVRNGDELLFAYESVVPYILSYENFCKVRTRTDIDRLVTIISNHLGWSPYNKKLLNLLNNL